MGYAMLENCTKKYKILVLLYRTKACRAKCCEVCIIVHTWQYFTFVVELCSTMAGVQ